MIHNTPENENGVGAKSFKCIFLVIFAPCWSKRKFRNIIKAIFFCIVLKNNRTWSGSKNKNCNFINASFNNLANIFVGQGNIFLSLTRIAKNEACLCRNVILMHCTNKFQSAIIWKWFF